MKTTKEKFYNYGKSLGIKINDLQRLRQIIHEDFGTSNGELIQSFAEANKKNFQLLHYKVKLECEIINLKERLSKYENINKQLKK